MEATSEFQAHKIEREQLKAFWEQLKARMSEVQAQLKTPESPQNIEDTPVAKQPTTQAKVGAGGLLREEIGGSVGSAPDQPTELKEDSGYQHLEVPQKADNDKQPTRSGADSNKANLIGILGKVAAVIVVFVIAIGVILYFRSRANKTLSLSLKTPFEIPFGEIMKAVFRAMR